MPNNSSHITWFRIALSYLIIAGILGSLMRLAFIIDLPEWINYRYVTHAHSHVAMLGWVYSGLYVFIVSLFNLNRKAYRNIFWLTQVSVLGMLVGFLIQGYQPISIGFTSLHLCLSYVFVFQVFSDLKNRGEKSIAITFLKTGLAFLLISTIGVWAIGVVAGMGLKGSALYYGSIQFFLHFQFNGWFIFTVLALVFKFFEIKKRPLNSSKIKPFYYLLVTATVLTYALAITWSTPDKLIFWTNSLGVLLQLAALIYFGKIIRHINKDKIDFIKKWTLIFWKIAFACFAFKIVIQSLVAIPYLATISYTIKNFVIGFIHLLMLGSISTFLFGLAHQNTAGIKRNYIIGICFFLIGFVSSEALLFLQGLFFWAEMGLIPFYYTALLLASICMPIGVFLCLISIRHVKTM